MRFGKHYAQFTLLRGNDTSILLGVIRLDFDVKAGQTPAGATAPGAGPQHVPGTCFFDNHSGFIIPTCTGVEVEGGTVSSGSLYGQCGQERDRIGLLLDLTCRRQPDDLQGVHVHVRARGLKGERCWAVLLNSNRVSVQINSVPVPVAGVSYAYSSGNA